MLTKEQFELLYEKYFDDVTSFLYMYAANQSQLKDWVQEVFIKLWKKRTRIDFDHPSFKSYLLKTARNHALKQLQKEKNYSSWLEENLIFLTEARTSPQESNGNISSDISALYRKVLAGLPPRARETWELSREDGLTYAEIAETMGVSVKTVETQISKVLHVLRKELGNIEY